MAAVPAVGATLLRHVTDTAWHLLGDALAITLQQEILASAATSMMEHMQIACHFPLLSHTCTPPSPAQCLPALLFVAVVALVASVAAPG